MQKFLHFVIKAIYPYTRPFVQKISFEEQRKKPTDCDPNKWLPSIVPSKINKGRLFTGSRQICEIKRITPTPKKNHTFHYHRIIGPSFKCVGDYYYKLQESVFTLILLTCIHPFPNSHQNTLPFVFHNIKTCKLREPDLLQG